MSMGSLGPLAGAAGSPYAQRVGSDVDRTIQDDGRQQMQVDSLDKAEKAAGVGETDGEDTFTSERDADGRRMWEGQDQPPPAESEEEHEPKAAGVKDPHGKLGGELDLSG